MPHKKTAAAKKPPQYNTRSIAAQCITAVARDKKSLNDVLARSLQSLSASDRSFTKQLCFGVIRHYTALHAIFDQYVKKPLKPKDDDIKSLLLVGMYQLLYMRTPEHAAINATVNGVKPLKKLWAKNFINGTLRAIQRSEDAAKNIANDTTNHPDWLCKQLQKDYPEQWQLILQENDKPAPMFIRVNPLQTTRNNYQKMLSDAGILSHNVETTASGLRLEAPVDVSELPQFDQGYCSVQDAAAQHCAELLKIQSGQRILDACAAPGGKTGHIAELAHNDAQIVALEKEPKRAKKIEENIQRLSINAQIIIGDASSPDTWWDGTAFDRILLDVPCSATGVIRRHPDIKLLRQPTDIIQLVAEQERILESTWTLLKPGGLLLYSTCSILPCENQEQIQRFLALHPEAEHINFSIGNKSADPFGLNLLPGHNHMDGFFYALLSKK